MTFIASRNEAQAACVKLLNYCTANDWAGYDPYDALNSPLLTSLPFLQARVPRLLLTQAFKRSPINIRPLARIPRTQNPKAIALFLIAVLRLTKLGALEDDTLAPLLTAISIWSYPRVTNLAKVDAKGTLPPADKPAATENMFCSAIRHSKKLLSTWAQRDCRHSLESHCR